MMFVGHRMDEIFRIADRIAVLRDGRLVGVEPRRGARRATGRSRMMVGRELSALYPHRAGGAGRGAARGRGADARRRVPRHRLQAPRAARSLGLGGLVGSGRTEIARALFGITRPTAGTIRLDGVERRFGSAARRDGRAASPMSRRTGSGQSLVMDFSIVDNAALTVLDETTTAGFSSPRKVIALVGPVLERLKLRFQSYAQPV